MLAADASSNFWPSPREVLDVLTLQAGYNTSLVVVGTLLLGIAAGPVGTFALLRKRSLMADALSHASLPGIALAFLLVTAAGGEGRSLLVLLPGAAITGVLGVVTIHLIVHHTRIREDAAIGAVLSVFFGAGVVLLSIIQTLETGTQGGLARFIYGQTAALQPADAVFLAAGAVLSVATAFLLTKEFAVLCFDQEFAAIQGWPIQRLDLLMMSLVVIVTVIGLQAVGLILVVALLIVPAAAARFWTERLTRLLLLSALFGGLSGYLGSSASALLPRFPAGSVIVLTAGALFVASLLFAPERGVLFDLTRRLRLRARVERDHFLRGVYEMVEPRIRQGEPDPTCTVADLARHRGWRTPSVALLTLWFRLRGLARAAGRRIGLTERGWNEATRLTRNHRLWEQYLIAYADVAPSHVDWSADLVEHALSPALVGELEAALRDRGELPGRLAEDRGVDVPDPHGPPPGNSASP